MSHPARLPLDLFCAQDLSKAKDHKLIKDLNRSAITQDLGAENTLDLGAKAALDLRARSKDPRNANAQDLSKTKDPHSAKDHKPIQDLNRSAITQAALDLRASSKDPRQASIQDLKINSKDLRQANAQDLIQAKDLNATKDPHNAKDHKLIQDLNRSAIAQDLGAESTLDPKISAPAKDPRQNAKEVRDE
ncbi:MAG: hypothetical protein ACTTIC_02930 [Helicobacteraceae bacterium]